MKFSSRNILIKIGLFQETPTACPSVKENRNKIENLPYGYDLKKKKMQTLEHISQVRDSSQILLTGPSGTQIDSRVERGHQPLRSEASQKHLPQKRSSLRRDFRIRQNNVNTTHTRDQKKKILHFPHIL